jgi:hypothetical protein
VYTKPQVNIILPKPYQTIETPGTVKVQFRVYSGNALSYIRVSLDDQDLQPMLEPAIFYPDGNTAEIDYNMQLGVVNPDPSAAYYLHIVVNDHVETNNYFQEVTLYNGLTQQVTGFYLMSSPAIQTTRIAYFDTNFEELLVAEVSGDFRDAAVISHEHMIFLATAEPSAIYAYRIDDEGEPALVWQRFPELPFPAFTDLQLFNNVLYSGTANGTIDGFNYLSGAKVFSTAIAFDSVPAKIGVSDDFVIGDFHPRSFGNNAIQSFFQSTGYFVQRRAVFYSVQDFYPLRDGNTFQFFGNTQANGLFAAFHVPGNTVSQLVEFPEGAITQSSRFSENEFIVSTGYDIYRFVTSEKQLEPLLSITDSITDMATDQAERNIYITTDSTLKVFAYPDMELLINYKSEIPVTGVRLRYAY